MIIQVSGTYELNFDNSFSNFPTQDIYLICNTSLAPVNILLFDIDKTNGLHSPKIYVLDDTGNAFTNNITIFCPPTNGINDSNSFIIDKDEGSAYLQIVSDRIWQCLSPTTSVPPIPASLNYGLFAQTVNSNPITGTISELSLLRTGVGSLSVPADSFKIGDSFQLNMAGHISARNNDTLTIRVKSNGTTLLATTGSILMANVTSQHWDLKANFTIRLLGTPTNASIASTILFTFSKNASFTFEGENNSVVNNTTFDTTISNTLDVTAQWSTTNANNNIYSETAILNKTY
jgi:hypothetical protein